MNTITTFVRYLKTLNTIFYVFLAWQILLTFFTVYMVEFGTMSKNKKLDVVFKYSLPILSFGLVMIGFVFFKIRLRAIEAADSLFDKLYKYKLAFLVKFGSMQAVAIFSLVACLTTQNYQYLLILLLSIIIQLMSKPSAESIIAKLKLNEDEKLSLLAGEVIGEPFKEKPFLVKYPVFFVVLIGFSLYSGYDVIKDFTKKKEWTAEVKEKMVKACILKAQNTAGLHPKEIKEYCECSNEAIIQKFTYEEIWENKKPPEELITILTPVFTECLKELKEKIRAKEKN